MKNFLLLSVILLGACNGGAGLNMGQYADPEASPEKFIYCYGYGCRNQALTNFTDPEWRAIQKIFKKKSKTPEDERKKISKAIAKMEQYMGEEFGTKNDLPKAPLSKESETELDCIDETVNTTKFLKFLEEADLLVFHKVSKPVYKGYMLNGVYPHNSAAVMETETGAVYVIDSYIFENGAEPNIRQLDNWYQYRVEELEQAEKMTRAAAESLTP